MGKPMTRIILAAFAFLGVVASAAQAETKKLDAAKVSLDPPAGWKVEEKPDQISMIGPNDEVAFLVLVFDGASDEQKKAAAGKADQLLNSIAKDVKWAGDWKKLQTNGMPTSANKGKATIAGKDSRIAVLMIESPAKKSVIFIAAIDATKEKEYTPTLKAFIDSIKPAT
jgi:hypothetical protein